MLAVARRRPQLTSPLLFNLNRNFADFFVFSLYCSTTGDEENDRIRIAEKASTRARGEGASRDDEAIGLTGIHWRDGRVERKRRGKKDILAIRLIANV